MENKNAFENKVFSWEAPEFIKHQKGPIWFIIAGIIAVMLIVYAVMSNSWTFAVAILIMSGVYFLYQHLEPNKIVVTISEMGVKFDSQEFPFSDIEAFWFIYKPPHVQNLHLRTKKKFQQDLVIPLENQDPAPLYEFLASKVPEWSDKEESIQETLIRSLKL